jgi:tetratricopeptide (TPR) repeat protein
MGIALVAALLLVGCNGREEAHKLYEEGRRIFRLEEDPSRAVTFFLKALEIDPTLTQAHMELSSIYLRQEFLREREAAILHLREIVRMAPNHIGANYELGRIAFRKGDFALALQRFETTRQLLEWPFGLESDRQWASLNTYEGLVLLFGGDVNRAEVLLRRSLSLNPADRCSRVGILLVAVARGDVAEVERYAGELERLVKPPDPLAYEGLMHIWMGRPERAIAVFELALAKARAIGEQGARRNALKQFNQRYRKLMAWAYWKAGKPVDARALAPGGLEDIAPSPHSFLTMWRCLK